MEFQVIHPFQNRYIHKKRSKKVYSVQFKLNVLNFMKQMGASYQDFAIECKINPSLTKPRTEFLLVFKETILSQSLIMENQ